MLKSLAITLSSKDEESKKQFLGVRKNIIKVRVKLVIITMCSNEV